MPCEVFCSRGYSRLLNIDPAAIAQFVGNSIFPFTMNMITHLFKVYPQGFGRILRTVCPIRTALFVLVWGALADFYGMRCVDAFYY